MTKAYPLQHAPWAQGLWIGSDVDRRRDGRRVVRVEAIPPRDLGLAHERAVLLVDYLLWRLTSRR